MTILMAILALIFPISLAIFSYRLGQSTGELKAWTEALEMLKKYKEDE